MTHYPVKILMAFGCTFEPGGEEFFEWLMRNGYPELGALSNTRRMARQKPFYGQPRLRKSH